MERSFPVQGFKINPNFRRKVDVMGIFTYNRQNHVSLSDDWRVFSQHFHNIGAFTYKKATQSAYFDSNAQRILQTEAVLSKAAYLDLVQKLMAEPVETEQNLYVFKNGAEKRYVKFYRTITDDDDLCFVEETSRRRSQEQADAAEFDAVTNMLQFPAFSSLVQRRMLTAETMHIAALYVEGMDKVSGFLAVNGSNYCMASVAEALNRFAGEHILLSTKSFQNFFVCFENMDESSVRLTLEQMQAAVASCTIADDFGQSIYDTGLSGLKLRVGISTYPEMGDSLSKLIPHAEFALFETQYDSQKSIAWFSQSDFERKKDEYREEQLFSAILADKENIAYHFQPIVNARTGAVVGYEALMRSEHFAPEKILDLATKFGRLYEIEYATLFNCLKFLSEHLGDFNEKKLFINCIPTALLNENDFNTLMLNYAGLFEKTVFEIVEMSDAADEDLQLLKSRTDRIFSTLAIDDYGSGYANTATLLRNLPQYVKIDRCLITDICKDSKKQQLVSSIIEYAHDNQIEVLAEGIEYEDDMKTVIRLGVDLLQGFYLSRPKAFLTTEIQKEIRDRIIETNLEAGTGQRKIYNAHNDEILDLVDLALQNYTDIHIYRHNITIIGDANKQVPMHIAVMDNHSCELKLRNVNLISKDKPTISAGNYAQLSITLEGDNYLDYMGIRVPQGSFFQLLGSGNLTINCSARFGYGIGSDCDNSYGSISMNSTGNVSIICNSDRGVGIGGGKNPDDSEIALETGKISIVVGAPNALGIGCMDGNSIIYTKPDCKLDMEVNGISCVGIGSLSGETHVECRSNISFTAGGSRIVCMGVLNQGIGEVNVENANLHFHVRTNFGTCIGAIGGQVDVTTRNCKVEVNAEGGEVTGIGDAKGSGDVTLEKTELKAFILAGKPHEAGSRGGRLIMQGSSIIADINDQHNTKK